MGRGSVTIYAHWSPFEVALWEVVAAGLVLALALAFCCAITVYVADQLGELDRVHRFAGKLRGTLVRFDD